MRNDGAYNMFRSTEKLKSDLDKLTERLKSYNFNQEATWAKGALSLVTSVNESMAFRMNTKSKPLQDALK